MNGAILDFNLLLGKEAQMGLFYIFMLRRGVGSLLSGCCNSDRLYSPLLFLCGFLIGQKNRFAEELVFCFLSFIFSSEMIICKIILKLQTVGAITKLQLLTLYLPFNVKV